MKFSRCNSIRRIAHVTDLGHLSKVSLSCLGLSTTQELTLINSDSMWHMLGVHKHVLMSVNFIFE